jgi:hypothetical protein
MHLFKNFRIKNLNKITVDCLFPSEFYELSNHEVVRLEKNSSEFFDLSNPEGMRFDKNQVPHLAGATGQVNRHG